MAAAPRATNVPGAGQVAVFVDWIELDADLWTAVWQRGPEHRDLDGSRDVVIAWALAQEADARWIFDADVDGYVPLERT